MNDPDDRFGFTRADMMREINAHKGVIRAGVYVPTRHEVATLELDRLYRVLIEWWWESPTSLIPSDAQIDDVIAVLKARPDADDPMIAKIIAERP